MDIQLARVAKQLAEQDLKLEVREPARELLAERGYDPVYGARPLKRAIQRYLQNELASRLLRREFLPKDTIVVDEADGKLTFAARSRIETESSPE